MIVSQKDLAQAFGVTVRRVRQLQQEGVIHKDVSGNGYDLFECNRAYIDYKVNSETGRKTAISKEQVQAEHEKVKMDISKLKLRRLRRESFDARAIEASWTSFLIYISGKLDTLGSKIIMAAAGAEINEQIKIADGIVAELKQELYDYDPKDVDEDFGDFDDEDENEDEDDEDI